MGCGASNATRVVEDENLHADNTRDAWKNTVNSTENGSRGTIDSNTHCKSFSRKTENNDEGPTNLLDDTHFFQTKTPGNMDLQERLKILSARRRSLQFEIGRNESDPDIDLLNFQSDANHSRQPPAQDFPKRKSIFPPPPAKNGFHSPYTARRRLSLTDSQKDFFRELDEKVAQGKDYHSEDEKSISSLISRNGSNTKLATILDALRSQHTR